MPPKAAVHRVFRLPFKPTRRNLTILSVLLAIFFGALAVRLAVTFHYGLPLGRDGPYHLFHVEYLAEHWPFTHSSIAPTHQLFFHFAGAVYGFLSTLGASLISSFNVAASLGSALVSLTTFFMMKKLTGNAHTSLAAAFFAAFIPASLRMFGELEKNAFAVSLTPIAVPFVWRALREGRKMDYLLSGLLFGAIGLTHELVFGVLAVTFVSYLALLMGYRRKFPFEEFKRLAAVGIIAGLLCGYFYLQWVGTIASMGGQPAMLAAAQEEPYGKPPPDFSPAEPKAGAPPRTVSEYMGSLMIVLSVVGIGVSAYRRKPHDLFLLAWMLSGIAMAQPWVMRGYEWRFTLMLATPVSLLAAVGLMEGIKPALWDNRPNLKSSQILKGSLVAVLVAVLLIQTSSTWTYAWHGEMLQPSITREQYDSLLEFSESYGSVYVFRQAFPIYWPDAVGLLGDIAGGSVVSSLSKVELDNNFDLFLSEWSDAQNELGENIYALAGPRFPGFKETDSVVMVFSAPGLDVYALNENVPSGSTMQLYGSPGAQENLPPEEWSGGKFEVKNVLLAPIYLLPSYARFVFGVPLTVFCWIFIPGLVWAALRPRFKDPEKMRKRLLALLVILFVSFFLPI